jgi:hypothetical protein
MARVDEAELAKALKRNRRAIRIAEQAGRITPGPDGLYDLEEAIAEFHATTHHEKGHNNRSGSPGNAPAVELSGKQLPEIPSVDIPSTQKTHSTDYAQARASTQVYEAKLKKLRYEERAGNLTPTADVESARFTEFRTLREACFNIPSRVAPLLATASSISTCQQLLEDELRKVFDAYSEGKLAA